MCKTPLARGETSEEEDESEAAGYYCSTHVELHEVPMHTDILAWSGRKMKMSSRT